MNPFTTVPRFIRGYIISKGYTSLGPQFEKLREEGRIEDEKELIRTGQKQWVEKLADALNLTFDVQGEENIPEKGPFMIYSNHQSFADIPSIVYAFRNHHGIGFVAKDEWRKYKILREACEYTRSIFLVRDNPREAVRALGEARKVLDLGFSLAIFPEGTRSQKHEPGEFKAGAFKFAEKAKVPIIPVTLDGGYRMFEEKGTYQPAHIKVVIHPAIHVEEMSKQEQKAAGAMIEEVIKSALD